MSESAPKADRRSVRERAGRRSEYWAAFYLQVKGYRLLARRYRCRVGEIDLVMRQGTTLVFVEVKWRQSLDTALWALQPRQIMRIRRAMGLFIARHPEYNHLDQRIDALLLAPWRWPRHYRHISDGL